MPLIRADEKEGGGGGRCVSSEEPFVFAYRAMCLTFANGEGRLTVELCLDISHTSWSTCFLPPSYFSPHVFPALPIHPRNYTRLLIFPLFFFLEVLNSSLHHLEYNKYILYRDFYCIGQLILFLLDRCYRLLFLYLLIGKYSNLSNGTNCNFEIGFNYNALLIAIFPLFFFLEVLNSSLYHLESVYFV